MLYSLTMFSKLCLHSQTAMRKRLFSIESVGLLLALAIILCAPPTAHAKPTIFNWSCIAGAGDIVNLQGHDLDGTTAVMCSVNDGDAESLPIVNRGNNILHVRMPLKLGLYAISVRKGSEVSNTVFPNRASVMHFDTPEVSPNGSFRIFGRNLCVDRSHPEVIFVNGGKRYPATVCGVPCFNELKVTAPSNIPVGRYSVLVNNGLTKRSTGVCYAPMLDICSSGPDTFKLAVPWSSTLDFGHNVFNVKTDSRLIKHAKGDGVINDQPAIQAAVDAASKSGGGVVFLPSGKYLLASEHGAQIECASNVVVRGFGSLQTKLVYGRGRPAEDFVFARFYKVSKCGLCDLAIENLNDNDAWLNTKSITNEGSPIDRVFLSRIALELRNGFRVELKGDRIAILNCNLHSEYSTLHLGTCTNSHVEKNVFTQKLGVHLDLTESKNCVVDGNAFILDANQGSIVAGNVRHGIAIGFASELAIMHNNFAVENGLPTYNNDGEAILSEGGGGIRTGEEVGHVLSGSGTLLTVEKDLPRFAETAVAIINGKGTGQWRRITSRLGAIVILDQPWQVGPNHDATYSIFRWSNLNTTISDNNFKSWLRGVWTCQGSTTDMQVSNNHFNEMDGIFFEPCQNLSTKNGQFNPVWNTTVDHNVLRSQLISPNTSKQKATATHINFTGDLQQTSSLIGTMSLNNQIYGNTIIGTGAEFFENDPAQTEGYCSYLRVEASKFEPNSTPAMLGLIFQNNKSDGCGQRAYLLNGGDYQTTIANPIDVNSKAIVTDETKYWNTVGDHKSVSTVILNDTAISNDVAVPNDAPIPNDAILNASPTQTKE